MHKKTMENSGEFSRTASHYTIGSGGILDVKLNGLRAWGGDLQIRIVNENNTIRDSKRKTGAFNAHCQLNCIRTSMWLTKVNTWQFQTIADVLGAC